MKIELSLSRLDTRPHSSQLSFAKISLRTVRLVFLHRRSGRLLCRRASLTSDIHGAEGRSQLQALVYHILPSTTAIVGYAMGLEKLSANELFLFCFVFDDAQTAVSLLQATQIISNVSFITDHVAYASTNKTRTV